MYGQRFYFVIIGTIHVVDENAQNIYKYCVGYNMDTKSTMTLSEVIVECCTIINQIHPYDLSLLLYECLDCNMGFIFCPISKFLKYHEQCRHTLMSYLAPLIRDTWTISEVKAERCMIIGDKKDTDFINMLDSILDSMFAKEADIRFKHAKAKQIQKTWRHAISNPNHPCCQKRLYQEAYELGL